MSNRQLELIKRAQLKYGTISPCGVKKLLSECFSHYKGNLYFWFNTSDNSTHTEIASIAEQ